MNDLSALIKKTLDEYEEFLSYSRLEKAESRASEWRVPIKKGETFEIWDDSACVSLAFLVAESEFSFADQIIKFAFNTRGVSLSVFCSFLEKQGVARLSVAKGTMRVVIIDCDFSHLIRDLRALRAKQNQAAA